MCARGPPLERYEVLDSGRSGRSVKVTVSPMSTHNLVIMKVTPEIEAPKGWKAHTLEQGDAKLILAVYAHLRAIYSVAVNYDGSFIRPTDMNQGDLGGRQLP